MIDHGDGQGQPSVEYTMLETATRAFCAVSHRNPNAAAGECWFTSAVIRRGPTFELSLRPDGLDRRDGHEIATTALAPNGSLYHCIHDDAFRPLEALAVLLLNFAASTPTPSPTPSSSPSPSPSIAPTDAPPSEAPPASDERRQASYRRTHPPRLLLRRFDAITFEPSPSTEPSPAVAPSPSVEPLTAAQPDHGSPGTVDPRHRARPLLHEHPLRRGLLRRVLERRYGDDRRRIRLLHDLGEHELVQLQRLGRGRRSAATASGIDLTQYTNVVHVFPRQDACWWDGMATLPGRNNWINGAMTLYVAAHEIGHNLGVDHASSLICKSGTVRVSFSSKCTVDEYGDPFDVMGANGSRLDAQLASLPARLSRARGRADGHGHQDLHTFAGRHLGSLAARPAHPAARWTPSITSSIASHTACSTTSPRLRHRSMA